jgi:hypothetical protein
MSFIEEYLANQKTIHHIYYYHIDKKRISYSQNEQNVNRILQLWDGKERKVQERTDSGNMRY